MYIDRILNRFGIHDCNLSNVPIHKGDKLSLAQCPKNNIERESMKNVLYFIMIRSVIYAQICTRPDIVFVVGLLGRYLSNPGWDHWVAIKKVLRYLEGTKDYILTYRKVDNLEVVRYIDSDFVGCKNNKKSIFGYIFTLVGGAIF